MQEASRQAKEATYSFPPESAVSDLESEVQIGYDQSANQGVRADFGSF